MATQKKTPEQIEEEQRKKTESMARYKRELIRDIEAWLTQIKTGEYTINKVELRATRDHVSTGVTYPQSDSYHRY